MEHGGDEVTIVYYWHHAGINDLKTIIEQQLGAGIKVNYSEPSKLIMLRMKKTEVERARKMMGLIHNPDNPVRIEAKVVELRWDKDLQIGVEGDLSAGSAIFTKNLGSGAALREVRLSLPASDATAPPFHGSTFKFFSSSTHRGDIGGIIQSFVERGKAQILSQPTITVKSGMKAVIHAGEEIPHPAQLVVNPGGTTVTVQYRKVGITLEVMPMVAAPNVVMLQLKPSVSTTLPGLVQVSPTFAAPQFAVREVDTHVLVRNGEEVVIGGLLRRESREVRRGLPFLSDIPILGFLFGKYEEAELIQEILFFIRATIVTQEEMLQREVFDPGRQK